MKKLNILSLLIPIILGTQTTSAKMMEDDKKALGVISHQESLLFHKSLSEQGSDNVTIWRIPSLLRTKDGVLIAAADKRWQHRGDWGDIDTALRISHDDGKTWGNITTILDLYSNNGDRSPAPDDPVRFNPWGDRANCTIYCNSAFLIDAQMVQDQRNGRIFLAVDMFSDGPGFFGVKESGNGYIEIDGKNYPILRHNEDLWTLRENGEVFDHKNNKTDYRVVVKGNPDHAFKDLGDIYNGDHHVGNIYVRNEQTPFLAVNTANIWITHSDDNGQHWANPVNLSAQVKKDWMKFFGTGPGVGIQTKNGNLLLPVYYTNQHGFQSTALVISKDGGESWVLGKSPNDTRFGPTINSQTLTANWLHRKDELTESQIIELENGDLKLFMRNKTGRVMMSTSKDGGYTWLKTEKIEALKHGYSQLSVIKYSKKINGKEYIIFSGQSLEGEGGDHLRRDGKLFLGEVQDNGEIKWLADNYKSINSQGKNNGYVYSSMAELGDGSIGLAYENTVDYTTIMYLPIEMQEFFWQSGKIFSNILQKMPTTFTYTGRETIEKIGDGIAVKNGQGKSLGGAIVSEGTLILAQQKNEKGENLAFTDVMLNNHGMVGIDGQQSIETLSAKENATGYLKFKLVDEKINQLNIINGITSGHVQVAIEIDKKLSTNTKGYYHHQGEKIIDLKGTPSIERLTLLNDIRKGMYVYTMATVAQSKENTQAKKSSENNYSVYVTNKLIRQDGSALPTLVSNITTHQTNARAQINPVLASYLSANIAIHNLSGQLHSHFINEIQKEGKERSLFVSYLNGQQKYHTDLSFSDYGYHFDTRYNGIMLGGKLYGSDNQGLYIAVNKTDYTVSPKAIDGETKANYRSWGVNLAYRNLVQDKIYIGLSGGYQIHKGDIEQTSGKLKGFYANIAGRVGYIFPVNPSFSVMPFLGVSYQHTALANVNDEINEALLRYNILNTLKTTSGVELGYKTANIELYGQLSYDLYAQKQNVLMVDNLAYKQGQLANTLNVHSQLKIKITPAFALSTGLGLQYARNKPQYTFKIGASYQF